MKYITCYKSENALTCANEKLADFPDHFWFLRFWTFALMRVYIWGYDHFLYYLYTTYVKV